MSSTCLVSCTEDMTHSACGQGRHDSPLAAGTFDASWDALGPFLQVLNLDGATLPHQLPPAWGQAFKNVTFISMGNAGLRSTLPPKWGMQGAFPKLYQYWSYGNEQLAGARSWTYEKNPNNDYLTAC